MVVVAAKLNRLVGDAEPVVAPLFATALVDALLLLLSLSFLGAVVSISLVSFIDDAASPLADCNAKAIVVG